MGDLKALGWAFLVAIIVDFVISWPVMLAWNAVVAITKMPEIGYWQAFSLMFLAGVVRAIFRGSNS